MARKLVPSTGPCAPMIRFSRAVRVGNHISIGGTAPIDAHGRTLGVGNAATQTRQCLETINAALEQAGASLNDVVRTRMLPARIDVWQQIARVRAEYFKDIRPLDTVLEVKGFINKECLIEMEVDAVVDED